MRPPEDLISELNESDRAFIMGFEKAKKDIENLILDYVDIWDGGNSLDKIRSDVAEEVYEKIKMDSQSLYEEIIVSFAMEEGIE